MRSLFQGLTVLGLLGWLGLWTGGYFVIFTPLGLKILFASNFIKGDVVQGSFYEGGEVKNIRSVKNDDFKLNELKALYAYRIDPQQGFVFEVSDLILKGGHWKKPQQGEKLREFVTNRAATPSAPQAQMKRSEEKGVGRMQIFMHSAVMEDLKFEFDRLGEDPLLSKITEFHIKSFRAKNWVSDYVGRNASFKAESFELSSNLLDLKGGELQVASGGAVLGQALKGNLNLNQVDISDRPIPFELHYDAEANLSVTAFEGKLVFKKNPSSMSLAVTDFNPSRDWKSGYLDAVFSGSMGSEARDLTKVKGVFPQVDVQYGKTWFSFSPQKSSTHFTFIEKNSATATPLMFQVSPVGVKDWAFGKLKPNFTYLNKFRSKKELVAYLYPADLENALTKLEAQFLLPPELPLEIVEAPKTPARAPASTVKTKKLSGAQKKTSVQKRKKKHATKLKRKKTAKVHTLRF